MLINRLIRFYACEDIKKEQTKQMKSYIFVTLQHGLPISTATPQQYGCHSRQGCEAGDGGEEVAAEEMSE